MTLLEKTKCKIMADEIRKHLELEDFIYNALCEVPREYFTQMSHHAYRLDAMPIAGKQYLSSPLTVAKITKMLDLKGVDSVLEIGCGSGYQAAILAKIVRRVFSIERLDVLVKTARSNFKQLKFSNINIKHDDGQSGWALYAPYDRVLLSAYIKQIPRILFDQMQPKGILVAPMQIGEKQHLVKFIKDGDKITQEIGEECLFVPILDGME